MTDQMTRLDWLLLLFFTAGFGVSAWMLWGGWTALFALSAAHLIACQLRALRIAIRSVNR